MNFQLTEEHLAVQQAARDFAKNELLPGVIDRDTHQKFPTEQIKKMGELGFLGMMVDPNTMAVEWIPSLMSSPWKKSPKSTPPHLFACL